MLKSCVETVNGQAVSKELLDYFEKVESLPESMCYERMEGDDWENDAAAFLDLTERKQEIDFALNRVRDRLIMRSNGSNAACNGVKVAKVTRKGNIDYKAIPELIGVDLESYRSAPMEYYRVCAEHDRYEKGLPLNEDMITPGVEMYA